MREYVFESIGWALVWFSGGLGVGRFLWKDKKDDPDA